ncbi:hypothetical protein BDZ89DRAFT_1111402 [Hymenopellis radicata]|nr:hypothetical protein BDZ89DRAFT_1111402 [Hymenopellis radicata]
MYLYGVPNKGSGHYRSANDFIPHALWLQFDSTENRQNSSIQKQKKRSDGSSKMPVTAHLRNEHSSRRIIIACQSHRGIPLAYSTSGVSLQEGDLAWMFLNHTMSAHNTHSTLHAVWPAMLVTPPDSSSRVDIQLLQVEGKHRVPLTDLLPYNAVSTSETLMNTGLSQGRTNFTIPPILGADDLLGQIPISWERVIEPFAYAVRIAAVLKTFWSPISDDPFATGSSPITGVWWGAEKLVVGDFVRLNVGRRDVFLSGATHSETVSAVSGNRECTLFLGINRILVRGAGQSKLVFAGMLYELCNERAEENVVDDFVEIDISEAGPSSQHSQQGTQTSDEFVEVEIPASANTQQSEPVLPDTQRISTSANNQQSEPVLPDAPIGYAFHPMIMDGFETLVPAELIQGRYHPRVMEHTKLSDVPLEALSSLAELEGLLYPPNTCPPSNYVFGRKRMLEKAEWVARKSLAKDLLLLLLESVTVQHSFHLGHSQNYRSYLTTENRSRISQKSKDPKLFIVQGKLGGESEKMKEKSSSAHRSVRRLREYTERHTGTIAGIYQCMPSGKDGLLK